MDGNSHVSHVCMFFTFTNAVCVFFEIEGFRWFVPGVELFEEGVSRIFRVSARRRRRK